MATSRDLNSEDCHFCSIPLPHPLPPHPYINHPHINHTLSFNSSLLSYTFKYLQHYTLQDCKITVELTFNSIDSLMNIAIYWRNDMKMGRNRKIIVKMSNKYLNAHNIDSFDLEQITVQVTGSLVSSAGDKQDHRARVVFERLLYTDCIM